MTGPVALTAIPEPPSIAARLLRIAVALGVVALLVWLVREIDLRALAQALARADVRLLGLAAALNLFANTYARVRRRIVLVEPLPGGRLPGLVEMTVLYLVSLAASNVLPARAGDAVFVAQMNRRHGYPVGALVASQLVEKLVMGLSLWLLAVPLALLHPLAGPFAVPVAVFAVAGLPAIALIAWAAAKGPRPDSAAAQRKGLHGRLLRFAGGLAEAVRLLHAPRVWARAVAWSLASDLVDAAMIGLCCASVGILVHPAAWVFVLLAINLAVAVPSTPGQAGVLEGAAVLTLGALGIARSEALAFALLYHAAHLVPSTLAAVAGLPYLQKRVR